MLRAPVAIAISLSLFTTGARAWGNAAGPVPVALPSTAGTPARAPAPAGSVPPVPAPAAGGEVPEVEIARDRAISALAAGDPGRALPDLEVIAAHSRDPVRRVDAATLAVRIRAARAANQAAPRAAAASGDAPAATSAVDATAPVPGSPAPTPASAPGATPATSAEPDQAGRTVFLATTTLLGLTAYGWTVPTTLNIESDRTFLALYMFTAGTSFVAPYLLTRKHELTWGTTNAAWYGGTRGLLHGAMIGRAIDPHASQRGTAISLLLGSVLELTATTLWATSTDPAPGTVRAMAWGGDFGLLFGLGIAHLTGLDLHDRQSDLSMNDSGARLLLVSGLLGNVGGVIAGKALADRTGARLTWGDGEVNRAAGLLGALSGAAIADWFDTFDKNQSRVSVGAMMIGSGLGLYLGHRLGLKNDFSVGRAVLVDLGTLAGGLLGAGITYLATSDTDDVTPFVTAAAGGAVLGFALTTYSLGVPGGLDTAASRGPSGFAPQLVPMLGRSGQRGVALAGTF